MQAQEYKTTISKQQFEEFSAFELVNHVYQDIFGLAYPLETRNSLNEKQLAIFYSNVISGEVSNGGFVQLFQNSGNELIEGGLAAFKLLDMDELAETFRDAVKIYRENIEWFNRYDDEDFDIESAKYKGVNDLDPLDQRFFEASEDLDKKLALYIKSNSEYFLKIDRAS